jgi:Ca2+-transporting ATPase
METPSSIKIQEPDANAAKTSAAVAEASDFKLDPGDALTPDPGTEDMFRVENNKFAFTPGQLSKLLNPKSLNALHALGGLDGLEKGLRTDRLSGLNADEHNIDGAVSFEDVAPKGTPKHGAAGDTVPESTAEAAIHIPPPSDPNPTGAFADRKRVFRDNRLPPKKEKTLLQIAWQTYNDKILILLTIAAAISLALGLYQTFGVKHEKDEPSVEWVEGVAILVAIT